MDIEEKARQRNEDHDVKAEGEVYCADDKQERSAETLPAHSDVASVTGLPRHPIVAKANADATKMLQPSAKMTGGQEAENLIGTCNHSRSSSSSSSTRHCIVVGWSRSIHL